ncbi:hypothetical protein C8J57DRAFT_1245883 [Mycena rebaudengoi]|nr:hypothetical protein C8J57DRAFT_1245883 [Mycena rebaudengoi]
MDPQWTTYDFPTDVDPLDDENYQTSRCPEQHATTSALTDSVFAFVLLSQAPDSDCVSPRDDGALMALHYGAALTHPANVKLQDSVSNTDTPKSLELLNLNDSVCEQRGMLRLCGPECLSASGTVRADSLIPDTGARKSQPKVGVEWCINYDSQYFIDKIYRYFGDAAEVPSS